MTVTQKAKNTSSAKNVIRGWKKSPGKSAKHLALSLNKDAIMLIFWRTKQIIEKSIT